MEDTQNIYCVWPPIELDFNLISIVNNNNDKTTQINTINQHRSYDFFHKTPMGSNKFYKLRFRKPTTFILCKVQDIWTLKLQVQWKSPIIQFKILPPSIILANLTKITENPPGKGYISASMRCLWQGKLGGGYQGYKG